jgi:hypothetical protein
MALRRRKDPAEAAAAGTATASFPAAWELRPTRLAAMPEHEWREACLKADYLGWELSRREEATRRDLQAIGYPQTLEGLERIYFGEPPQKSRNSRERRRLERGHRAYVALLVLRNVREAVAARDLYRAVRIALSASVAGGLLDAAEMGARIRAAERAGGNARAESRRPEMEGRRRNWQRQAEKIWHQHPRWSKSNVARAIVRENGGGSVDVIRRCIQKTSL